MNIGKEGETGMDLVERYLKAVAAQLPKDNRDDIVAEPVSYTHLTLPTSELV